METRILDYLLDCMKEQKYTQMSAVRCARALKESRVDVSACMSAMVENGQLIRILCRPYLFIPVQGLKTGKNSGTRKDYPSLQSFLDTLANHPEKSTDPFDRLVGSHHSLRPIISQMKAAISYPPAGLPILLKGPTGTGKSQMAALAFEWARKNALLSEDAQFVQLNCSEYANNPELLNASLFGYVKGAFTGADKDTSGLAALADGGILFLDEVHNLSPQSQEKLFHLMDQGIYHQMGDNENILHSHCRMIFATTEDPDEVLLRTLNRRIPIVIEVPSLQERGKRERIALIARLIEQEQKRLNRPVYLSGSVYNLLLNAEISGNIGELKSIIQFCCVNALFEANTEIRINLHHIPVKLITQRSLSEPKNKNVLEFYTVSQLLQLYDEGKKIIRLSSELLGLFETLKTRTDHRSLIMKMRLTLMKYLDEYIDEARESKNGQSYYWMALRQAFSVLQGSCPAAMNDERLGALASLIQEISFNELDVQNWSLSHEEKCLDLVDLLEHSFFQSYRTAQEVCLFLQSAMELNIYPMVIVILFLYLLDPIEQDVFRGRAVLIAAHGFSTASSIADAANQLLGRTVFDAIDMPVTSSVDDVIEKVQLYVSRFHHLEELILLVDMGSLESILDGLQNLECAIGLIDHVSTPVALEIGSLLSSRTNMVPMLEQTCRLSPSTYRIKASNRKKPAIVCCCASGIGTAQRLESLLQSSLPADCGVQILSVSYPHLLQEKKTSPVFQEWNVRCLIGTLNPDIEEVEFISVENLVVRDHFSRLENCLKEYLTEQQAQLFQLNLLKNFSLYNLMSELTVLNPQKLLEQITPCVERLQTDLGITLTSMTCIGLYVHISCMIERIAFTRLPADPASETVRLPADPALARFIRQCKDAFRPLESQYHVQIPDSEIAYIYQYILHDGDHEDLKTADF